MKARRLPSRYWRDCISAPPSGTARPGRAPNPSTPPAPCNTPAKSSPSAPRPIGSANHKKLENYILAHLKGRPGRRRRLHRRHSRRQVSGAKYHRQVSRHPRRHHRHRRPLRHQLSPAQYRLRRRQRRRLVHRHPAGTGQPASRQEARRLQRLAAFGPMAKKPSKNWTATDSLYGAAIWPTSGKKTARSKTSKLSCSLT